MMHIDEPESLKSQYRQAKDPKDWIIKNAQTLACTPWELGTWLQEHGEEVEKEVWIPFEMITPDNYEEYVGRY